MFLLMNKNDVTHLINQNLNLHVLIFIFNRKNDFWVKNTGFYQKIIVQIFAKGMFSVTTTMKIGKYFLCWLDRYLL